MSDVSTYLERGENFANKKPLVIFTGRYTGFKLEDVVEELTPISPPEFSLLYSGAAQTRLSSLCDVKSRSIALRLSDKLRGRHAISNLKSILSARIN